MQHLTTTFFSDIYSIDSIRHCSDVFTQAVAPWGFDTFACGDIDIESRGRAVFYAVQWPDDWRDFYISSRLHERDPLVDALGYRIQAFTWTDLRADRKFCKLGSEVIQRAAERGWAEGFIVPFRRGGSHFGLVSLAGRKADLAPEGRQFLNLLATCFYYRVRDLAPVCGFAVPPFGLTQRELDCLARVAEGLSDRQIGKALDISALTAHDYVQSGKRKLQVRTRAQAVAIAIAYGLLRF